MFKVKFCFWLQLQSASWLFFTVLFNWITKIYTRYSPIISLCRTNNMTEQLIAIFNFSNHFQIMLWYILNHNTNLDFKHWYLYQYLEGPHGPALPEFTVHSLVVNQGACRYHLSKYRVRAVITYQNTGCVPLSLIKIQGACRYHLSKYRVRAVITYQNTGCVPLSLIKIQGACRYHLSKYRVRAVITYQNTGCVPLSLIKIQGACRYGTHPVSWLMK